MQRAVHFRWLYPLFFLSGFPALLYQIVWQRTLFAIYGVNIESVTVVVSAFMLGLGMGSLAGGRISRNPRAPLLVLFSAAEFGIAAYGLASLPLFHRVAAFTAGAPAAAAGMLSFALVLIPTILMGATLPLLVAQLVRISGNVGRSVGILYFVNTLGSAVACFAAALFAMRYLGESGTVHLAAALNAVVAGGVGLLACSRREAAESPRRPGGLPDKWKPAVGFRTGMVLSAVAGFISLCYEIVWYRLYSFATGTNPKSFAYVLGAFLAGIAFGSLFSRRLCRIDTTRGLTHIAALVLAANLFGFAVAPLTGLLVRHSSYLWTLPLVALAAGLLGATFPLICHLSIGADSDAGEGLSYLYLANIIGSAGGTWLVGFVLMDYLTLRGLSALLIVLGAGLALALFAASGRRLAMFGCAAAGLAVALASGPLLSNLWGEMEYKDEWGGPGTALADVVETRSGVVTVDADGAIFGGGVYDGWMYADLHDNPQIRRPLSISYLHPDPKEVLMIGMSGGSWTEIIANHPQVQKVVCIEINPGYVEVIRRYPQVAPLLSNPKVEIHYDDGRRWMSRNRGRKFDMIVADTTYSWRAHATNLLSVEFLDLARQLLKPDGILYYNTTFSYVAQHTGAMHFPYALRFGPLLAVSDTPIQLDRERWRRIAAAYTLEGRPMFDFSKPDDEQLFTDLMHWPDTLHSATYISEGMETRENLLRRTARLGIITDDNMLVEWRESAWR
jgi:predicted membrane-bound spermidine synthase